MRLIKIMILVLIASPLVSSAAVWSVEIKDAQSSEVKVYKFSEAKTHKLETPKLKVHGCVLAISDHQVSPTDSAQLAEAQCFSPLGAFLVRKACMAQPNEIEKKSPLVFQVIDDSDKALMKKKKPEFRSYQISINCE